MPDATQPRPRREPGDRTRLVALPGGQAGRKQRFSLPSAISSFVGREDELGEIVGLIRSHRLVTLTGAGGSGKTRLGLAVAGELTDIFASGLWVVELAPISDSDLVPRAVASVAGVGERPGQPLTETLTEVLRSRRALLILDNCEHLIDACAALVETLLNGCPDLKVLATSREALGLTGEIAWPVPPLQQAVRLFTERAQAVRPSFALTSENTPAVTRIAEQLDGLPLALELAAARVRVLSVAEISDRLDHALPLLVGERTSVARHHTLKATFDWSHALLTATEQVLFRRLSVFRGGFTLAAAEAVCAGDGLDADAVLDVLGLLVEKSLVIADQGENGTRYRLLEVVRQYAGRTARGGRDGCRHPGAARGTLPSPCRGCGDRVDRTGRAPLVRPAGPRARQPAGGADLADRANRRGRPGRRPAGRGAVAVLVCPGLPDRGHRVAAGRRTSVPAGRPRGQGQGAQRPGHPGRVPGELRPGLGLRPGVLGPVPGARRRQRHRRRR